MGIVTTCPEIRSKWTGIEADGLGRRRDETSISYYNGGSCDVWTAVLGNGANPQKDAKAAEEDRVDLSGDGGKDRLRESGRWPLEIQREDLLLLLPNV